MELTYKIEAPGAVLLRTGSHDSSQGVPEAGSLTEFLPGKVSMVGKGGLYVPPGLPIVGLR